MASSGVLEVRATEQAGELILSPTHAVPGTLVKFEGVGWAAESYGAGHTRCLVQGEPVKIDSHAVCDIVSRLGSGEPVGTFIVRDIPSGTYSVFVIAYLLSGTFTGSAKFTVDGKTTIATTTVRTSSLGTVVPTTQMTQTSEGLETVTLTTTAWTNPATNLYQWAYGEAQFLVVLVVVALCVIVAFLAYVLPRRTRKSLSLAEVQAMLQPPSGPYAEYLTKLDRLRAQGVVSEGIYRKLRREWEEKERTGATA
jgi:hypothetical protein